MFYGEDTFLKKGYLPRTPSSKNFQRNYFYRNDKSNSNFFIKTSKNPVSSNKMIERKNKY